MSEPGPVNAHARKTVLIVDDDHGTLHVLKNGIGTILDMFDVLTAGDGREAIDVIEANHVDAIVTDLAMPVMDGFALIAYVTNLKRALPVVVLSGLPSSDIGDRLAPYGALRVLSKPASYHDVAESLLMAIEHVALGHVEGIPLPGVLQLVESERRSCTVVVTSGRRKGRLSFQSGRLIDAFSEDFGADGEAAAYDILSWDDTSIAFEHLPDNVRRTIHTPMQLMLIEVALTQDTARERTERSMPAAAHIEFATTSSTDGEPAPGAVPASEPAAASVAATDAPTDAPHADPHPPDDRGSTAPGAGEVQETVVPATQVVAHSPNGSRTTAAEAPAEARVVAPVDAQVEPPVEARAEAPAEAPTAADPADAEAATHDGGTTMTATDTHETLIGAVERLTERVREADAALAAVAAEVDAFREAQRAFDAVAERRERRRLELEAFRSDVASLAREILGRVDGMFSTDDGPAGVDERPSEAGTAR